ncbi:MAG: GNAT family N-acetyltransferase [Saprospiraceae bacterium]|nr:GNAT family N-acetyltransferase [Saprospiraceae bacterium]
MATYSIRKGSIAEAVAVSRKVPELIDPHGVAVYEERLAGKPNLVLIAEVEGQLAGFKVGYERDGYFYSWMGGVVPGFRQIGIAQALADEQEAWARQHNYPHITFKTRNQHRGMLLFAIKNGFKIIGFKEREHVDVHRILLRKTLK